MKKMSEYIKPVVLDNADLAEGVYAASGVQINAATGNSEDPIVCWSGDAVEVQDYVDGCKVYEARVLHSTAVEHISTGCTFTLHFNTLISVARAENADWNCTVQGTDVVVHRVNHANAYKSGDTVTFKVWVGTGEEATTKALPSPVSIDFACDKATNVQGGGADGN